MVRSSLLALGAVGLCVCAASAHAQAGAMDDHFVAPNLVVGMGGAMEIGALEFDREPSFGVQLRYGAPLHRYFVLGAELGVVSWQVDFPGDRDRSVLLSLSLVPLARLDASEGVELYVGLPLGLGLDFVGDADAIEYAVAAAGAGLDVSPSLGLHVAIVVGARFALAQDAGLTAELGYGFDSFQHEVEGAIGLLRASAEVEIDLDQPVLSVGAYFDI